MDALCDDDIRRIAALAKLELTAEEVADARARLSAVLSHMDGLRGLDTAEVEPMAHASDAPARLRADEPGPTLDAGTLEAMAPAVFKAVDASGDAAHDGEPTERVFVRVPKVLGEGGGA